ncbi:condensin complex protein MksE, partial [Burkholderia pyrrocinia]|uniref:condensin complex protein MksE n=1 Tax=Burkholderia pyrrocinia TaxID=60550 RepID=UPI0014049D76
FVADQHGFYYFNGSKKGLAKGVEQYALFTYIMIDWLSDNDHGIEDGLFGASRHVRDLPHLKSERYRGYMRQIGGDDEMNLIRIVGNMERAGFVRQSADRIQFLAPTRRILKVCIDLAKRTGRTDCSGPANEGESA